MYASVPRFPYTDEIALGDRTVHCDDVNRIMGAHLSDRRRASIERVLGMRTFSIATVCDNVYDVGNIAAVMRSAEAMGIQPFHIIRRQDEVKTSKRITAGADKWLDIHTWEGPQGCVEHLRARGYKLVVTQLAEDCVPIGEVDFTEPTALVFGNEHSGVSPDLLEQADARCVIPMRGFAESFNISVAAALAFYHVASARDAAGGHGDLSAREQDMLRAQLYMRASKTSEAIVAKALEEEGR
jgi:tRNA (guanosine-2'-O-)-methyltransferase